MRKKNEEFEVKLEEKMTLLLNDIEKIHEENCSLRKDIEKYDFKLNEILKINYRQEIELKAYKEELDNVRAMAGEVREEVEEVQKIAADTKTEMRMELENFEKNAGGELEKRFKEQEAAAETRSIRDKRDVSIQINEVKEKISAKVDKLNQEMKNAKTELEKRFEEQEAAAEARRIQDKQDIVLRINTIKENVSVHTNKLNEEMMHTRTELHQCMKEEISSVTAYVEQGCMKVKEVVSEENKKIRQENLEVQEAVKKENTKIAQELKQIEEARIKEKNEFLLNESMEKEKYITSIWNLEGATDKLLNMLEQWMFSEGNITENGRLIYLCCLLERGQEDMALVGLKKYIQENGEENVSEFLPLTLLAWKNGIGGEMIKKAACVFEKLENDRKGKSLFHYLEDKSFVIVGNAPSILGTDSGKQIDAKDVVFRMNTYKLSEEYIKDTGKKITAFVDNSNFATINHPNHAAAKNLELIYIPYDFWHIKVSQFCMKDTFINSYYEMLDNKNLRLSYLEPQDSVELKKALKIISPSSGMAIFWTIYKMYGYVRQEWFTGFSNIKEEDGMRRNPLKDKGDSEHPAVQSANWDAYFEKDELTTFYKNAPIYSKGQGHNFNRETALRQEIINRSENGEK